MNYYLGFDVGGTKCAAVVGDESGVIHDRVTWASEAARGPGAMIEDLVDQGRMLLHRWEVRAAGVAIGGPLDSREGVIYSPPNLPGWDAVHLKQQLESAIGISVVVEHDAAACALAEYRWGAGAGAERLAYLTCGTGLGLGLVFDGNVYRGASGNAPDFGHISYRADGPLAYGKRGSLESFGAGSAIARLANWRFPDRWAVGSIDGPGIAALAAEGDRDAIEIIHLNADAVGDACALLGDTIYTDLIVLGSLARYLGESWLDRVKFQFNETAHPRVREICRIVPAGLGEKLQDCSSYVAAI
ncbi:MAG TPA: ROK family protein [Tepidisphaeraceae bacterium]|nr:ROK family protein [Tepidisphaeraceae bacterium]